jgi:hypothetical protein
MNLTWFENRLLSYNTFPFYLPVLPQNIINPPVSPKQLDRIQRIVFNADFVGENIVILSGIGILTLKFGLYRHFYTCGYLGNHFLD